MRAINSRNSRNSSDALSNAKQLRIPSPAADDEMKPLRSTETITDTEQLLTTVTLNRKMSSSGIKGTIADGTIRTMTTFYPDEEKPSTTSGTNPRNVIQARTVISEDENQVKTSGFFEESATSEMRTETPLETLTSAEESSGTCSILPSSKSATRLPTPPSYTSLLANEDFNRWPPHADGRTSIASKNSESSLESGIDTRNLYADPKNLEQWVMSTLEYRSPVEDDFEIGSIGDSDQHDIGDSEQMKKYR